MKVMIEYKPGNRGCLKITAENDLEGYALSKWCDENLKHENDKTYVEYLIIESLSPEMLEKLEKKR